MFLQLPSSHAAADSYIYHLCVFENCEHLLSAGFGADVDSFVVRTNYDEYAVMLQLSTEKPSGSKTTILKLYSE